ncbi:hypothetical protein FJZ17_04000 [Candidatus Pacearchaeota archaeon]|nr:hypothetical protein [Candidatus Pacearchaeota archaeon]
MKNKKRVLIIVHGAWPIKLRLRVIEKVKENILDFLTTKRGITRRDYHKFKRYMEEEYDIIEVLRWSGGLTKNFDIKPAKKHLKNLLRKHKREKVDIISFSLGGLVSQEALKECPDIKINNVLLAGTINNPEINFKNCSKVFNVYSEKDKFQDIAELFYEKTIDKKIRSKNVKNIALKEVRHDELCKNKRIKTQRLYEFYKNLLIN